MAEPLYRQIAEDLRLQIESGELRAGEQLPTENELSAKYDRASRNTVRAAIRWLTSRALVTTQPGRGTFVVEQIKPFTVPLSPAGPGLGVGRGRGVRRGRTPAERNAGCFRATTTAASLSS